MYNSRVSRPHSSVRWGIVCVCVFVNYSPTQDLKILPTFLPKSLFLFFAHLPLWFMSNWFCV